MTDKTNLANTTAFRIGATLFGLLFAAMGGVALLSVLGVLQGDVSQTAVSRVFGVLASTVFICAGLGMMLFGLRCETAAARLGGIALLAFVLTFNWIAFGPGERSFQSSTSVGGAKHTSPASETEGRIVFGLFSLAMDALIVYGFVAARRKKDE